MIPDWLRNAVELAVLVMIAHLAFWRLTAAVRGPRHRSSTSGPVRLPAYWCLAVLEGLALGGMLTQVDWVIGIVLLPLLNYTIVSLFRVDEWIEEPVLWLDDLDRRWAIAAWAIVVFGLLTLVTAGEWRFAIGLALLLMLARTSVFLAAKAWMAIESAFGSYGTFLHVALTDAMEEMERAYGLLPDPPVVVTVVSVTSGPVVPPIPAFSELHARLERVWSQHRDAGSPSGSHVDLSIMAGIRQLLDGQAEGADLLKTLDCLHGEPEELDTVGRHRREAISRLGEAFGEPQLGQLIITYYIMTATF